MDSLSFKKHQWGQFGRTQFEKCVRNREEAADSEILLYNRLPDPEGHSQQDFDQRVLPTAILYLSAQLFQ